LLGKSFQRRAGGLQPGLAKRTGNPQMPGRPAQYSLLPPFVLERAPQDVEIEQSGGFPMLPQVIFGY